MPSLRLPSLTSLLFYSSMATATTNKRIKSATDDTEGRDLISELPEEIIHQVLRRIASPAKAARTTALSRRWRSVWSCYPVLKFRHSDLPRPTVDKRLENFKKFVEASIERVSQHSQMRIETLDISLVGKPADYSSLVKQLLKLAMEREVEEISVILRNPGRFIIHANFGAKILRLTGKELEEDDYQSYFLPFLASLRSLQLKNISGSLLSSLIAKCHLLETLEIGRYIDLKKLQISDFPHLKTLKINTTSMNQEIEIEAPRLQNLHLSSYRPVQKMELRAPQLKHLEIKFLGFTVDFLNVVISELPSLKTLTLNGFRRVMKKLKLSIPKLEVFKLLDLPSELEEIELDAGPTLSRFFLQSYSPGGLRKCTINNASACRLEANFTIGERIFTINEERQRLYLGFVKSFISRFPQFQTVCISYLDDEHNVTYHEEETGDNTSNPMSIDHLKYCTVLSNSKVDKHALLEALFRVCRPNHLTLIHRHKNSERFFQGLLSIMQQKGGADKSLMWLNGLKDVKIITQDVDVEIEKEEELIMRYSKCKTKNQLCLELTWG
ncbi:Putative F-box/LRR-repeat protein At3g18150 [Linum perenne]